MIKKYKPFYNVGPGPFIKEELDARNWRQEDLASIIGMSLKTVNQLIKNKQAITVPTALLLGKAFGQSPQFWLNLDANYRLRIAEDRARVARVGILAKIYRYMPIKEMISKTWFRKSGKQDDIISQVREFWGNKTLDFAWINKMNVTNLKKSTTYDQIKLNYTYTWFQMARKCAGKYKTGDYDIKKLNNIIHQFSDYLKNNNTHAIINDLNSAGVKFFILSQLKNTKLDGAAFCDNTNPVIVYTMRENRIDNFWLTVAHAIAHVKLHIRGKNDYFIDNLEVLTTREEKEADDFALRMIKATRIIEYFKNINTYISRRRIIDCASKVGVSPSIVVGILQHQGMHSRRNITRLKEIVSDKIPIKYHIEKNLSR